jgi:acyl-CoA thioesterase
MSELVVITPGSTPSEWRFEIHDQHLTPAGAAQGGVVMAAAVEAVERSIRRPLVWATGRYLRHVAPGTTMVVAVEEDVVGHATTQASATGTVDDVPVISVVAAGGSRPFPPVPAPVRPPTVDGPDGTPRYPISPGRPSMADGFDVRLAAGRLPTELDGVPGSAESAFWLRLPWGRRTLGVADIAIVADFAMLAVSHTVGRRTTGNSLDNTIRIVRRLDADEVLLDVTVVALADGFGHVESRLWTPSGELVAVASTTLVLREAGTDGQSTRSTRRIVGQTGGSA